MGTVFNIQKFSINDGPGIRTAVFLKGCPLKCLWCHNPESLSPRREVFYRADLCAHCLVCATRCPQGCHRLAEGGHRFTREGCSSCGTCAAACPTGALEAVGQEMTPEEVIREVLRDEVFYRTSGGGITVSGGEPLYQLPFTLAILRLAKEKGLHTCLETCGFAPWESIKEIAPYVDLFLYDYTETDPDLHRAYTGAPQERILENLKGLGDLGASIILRCPIIPGKNDRPDHFEGIGRWASAIPTVKEVQVEPYHPLGEGKARLLGKEPSLVQREFPGEDEVKAWIQNIQKHTDKPVKQA